jgi:hypothetical protein
LQKKKRSIRLGDLCALEERINKRRCGRAGGQNNEAPQHKQTNDNRHHPEFLPFLHEGPQLYQQFAHDYLTFSKQLAVSREQQECKGEQLAKTATAYGCLLTADCCLLLSSVLSPQMRCRTWFAEHSITIYIGLDLLAHRVLTKQTPDHSDGRYDQVEDNAQNNPRVDPPQYVSQSHPPFVDPRQAFGKCEGGNHQESR